MPQAGWVAENAIPAPSVFHRDAATVSEEELVQETAFGMEEAARSGAKLVQQTACRMEEDASSEEELVQETRFGMEEAARVPKVVQETGFGREDAARSREQGLSPEDVALEEDARPQGHADLIARTAGKFVDSLVDYDLEVGPRLADWIERWQASPICHDEEPKLHRMKIVLNSQAFEMLMAVVIFVNFVVIIRDTDMRAKGLPPPSWIDVTATLCFLCYCIEYAMRLFVEGAGILKSYWNILDTAIILIGVVEWGFEHSGINMNSFTVLRAVRLFRLLRLLRAMKISTRLRELRKLLQMMMSCAKTLVWSFMICFLVMTMWAVAAVEFVHPSIKSMMDSDPYLWEDCERCHRAFASVWSANLTFFQTIVAGDSWGLIAVPVSETHPETVIIFMGALITMIFGVLNLVVAVIVDTFAENRARDVATIAEEMDVEEVLTKRTLTKIFSVIHDEGSGMISFDALKEGAENVEELKNWLRVMDVDEDDLYQLFKMVDVHDAGRIDAQLFVEALYRLRNSEQRTATHLMKHSVGLISQKLEALGTELQKLQDLSSPAKPEVEEHEDDHQGNLQRAAHKINDFFHRFGHHDDHHQRHDHDCHHGQHGNHSQNGHHEDMLHRAAHKFGDFIHRFHHHEDHHQQRHHDFDHQGHQGHRHDRLHRAAHKFGDFVHHLRHHDDHQQRHDYDHHGHHDDSHRHRAGHRLGDFMYGLGHHDDHHGRHGQQSHDDAHHGYYEDKSQPAAHRVGDFLHHPFGRRSGHNDDVDDHDHNAHSHHDDHPRPRAADKPASHAHEEGPGRGHHDDLLPVRSPASYLLPGRSPESQSWVDFPEDRPGLGYDIGKKQQEMMRKIAFTLDNLMEVATEAAMEAAITKARDVFVAATKSHGRLLGNFRHALFEHMPSYMPPHKASARAMHGLESADRRTGLGTWRKHTSPCGIDHSPQRKSPWRSQQSPTRAQSSPSTKPRKAPSAGDPGPGGAAAASRELTQCKAGRADVRKRACLDTQLQLPGVQAVHRDLLDEQLPAAAPAEVEEAVAEQPPKAGGDPHKAEVEAGARKRPADLTYFSIVPSSPHGAEAGPAGVGSDASSSASFLTVNPSACTTTASAEMVAGDKQCSERHSGAKAASPRDAHGATLEWPGLGGSGVANVTTPDDGSSAPGGMDATLCRRDDGHYVGRRASCNRDDRSRLVHGGGASYGGAAPYGDAASYGYGGAWYLGSEEEMEAEEEVDDHWIACLYKTLAPDGPASVERPWGISGGSGAVDAGNGRGGHAGAEWSTGDGGFHESHESPGARPAGGKRCSEDGRGADRTLPNFGPPGAESSEGEEDGVCGA